MELLDSVMVLTSWPRAFATVPTIYVAPLSGKFTRFSVPTTSGSCLPFAALADAFNKGWTAVTLHLMK